MCDSPKAAGPHSAAYRHAVRWFVECRECAVTGDRPNPFLGSQTTFGRRLTVYDAGMYSYRHGFHAGNHADVLKHLCLIGTARHLMRKPTPLLMVDTHAGAGLYRLDSDYARTSGEAQEGVRQLVASGFKPNMPPALEPPAQAAMVSGVDLLQDYLGLVASFNTGTDDWRIYPGSPFLMQRLMDEPARAAVHDRLKLFEMHPTDAHTLLDHVTQLNAGRRISVAPEDGFASLKALIPPPPAAGGSRRAMVLIDPSYEIKTDYAKVAASIQDALKRFATGVYLVWYPIIPRPEAHGLPRRLRTLTQQAGRSWLHATLNIGAAPDGSGGLSASGMFIVNPPHPLTAALQQVLPTVTEALGRGRGAGWVVESSNT